MFCLPNTHPYVSIFPFLEQWAHPVSINFWRDLRHSFPIWIPNFPVWITPHIFFVTLALRHRVGAWLLIWTEVLTSQCSTGRGFHGMSLVWWAARLVLGHPGFRHERSPDLGHEEQKRPVCTRYQPPSSSPPARLNCPHSLNQFPLVREYKCYIILGFLNSPPHDP